MYLIISRRPLIYCHASASYYAWSHCFHVHSDSNNKTRSNRVSLKLITYIHEIYIALTLMELPTVTNETREANFYDLRPQFHHFLFVQTFAVLLINWILSICLEIKFMMMHRPVIKVDFQPHAAIINQKLICESCVTERWGELFRMEILCERRVGRFGWSVTRVGFFRFQWVSMNGWLMI